jgi:catechol 2,3-dioxygenase-like lactoylglutathione lyase family enzyme
MKIEALDHIHVYSADPQASASFYQDHFDAREVFRNQNVHGQSRIFLSLGSLYLVLSPFPPGITPSAPPKPGDGAYSHGFGVAHFGLKVKDVEQAAALLDEAGVKLLGDPVHESTGLSYCYLAAPDGVVVELTQYEA